MTDLSGSVVAVNDEQPLKKIRLEDPTAQRDNFRIVTYPRANSLVKIFVRSHLQAAIAPSEPWFTHQIFPDEKIELDSESFPACSSIEITIDAKTIEFSVHVKLSEAMADDKRVKMSTYLREKLPAGVPTNTPITFTSPDYEFQETLLPAEVAQTSALMDGIPVGTLVHTFDRLGASEDANHYAIYLATYKDAGSEALLARLEKVAMWYIETASAVDFHDDKWEMLVLYQFNKSNNGNVDSAEVVGYLTLYTFHNPFLGSKIRICQALVLPNHQKKGFGRELMLIAYQLAAQRNHIVEITVEDPCQAFQSLRNQIDYEMFVRHYGGIIADAEAMPSAENVPDSCNSSSANSIHDKLNSTTLEMVTKALKITPLQAAFVKELQDFVVLLREVELKNPGMVLTAKDKEARAAIEDALEDLPTYKDFRLKVKRGLLKQDKELSALPKKEMQRALTEMYEERWQAFMNVVPVMQKLRLL